MEPMFAALAARLLIFVTAAQAHVYDRSFDTGAVAATRRGCDVRPAYECFAGAPLRVVRDGVRHSGDCCALCADDARCAQYNFRLAPAACELFDGTAAPAVDARSGCASGAVARTREDAAEPDSAKPNIVFLAVESTDGRTWSEGYSDGAIPLPHIRSLQARGVEFRRHYSNAPVCCPSRATFWSGRHAHKIPHASAVSRDLEVEGVWNNYEGLPGDFSKRLDQVLANKTNYAVFTNGKFDWTTGGHSENVYLDAWTTYARTPYDVNASGGWALENCCASRGTIHPGGGLNGTRSAHAKDWENTWEACSWMAATVSKNPTRPFFLFTGHEIVHPDYVSNEFWSGQIDRTRVSVPPWKPLLELHPCDFQSSMLKGCAPSDENAEDFYSADRRREVRALYYAMIAEFDDMVGTYVKQVEDLGLTGNTVFIVTSDHGDMQMEKQQFYKMSPYDASASVPMVVADGRRRQRRVVTAPTQLIDLVPTILDLAGVEREDRPAGIDGASLAPLLEGGRWDRDFVVSQFHGDNVTMSWFLAVAKLGNATYKYVVWGTGAEHPSRLFELGADEDENDDLAASRPDVVAALDARLRSVVDYGAVARDVARYNHASFALWANKTGPRWRDEVHHPGLRWDPAFNATLDASLAALEDFLADDDPQIQPCRLSLAWPPKAA